MVIYTPDHNTVDTMAKRIRARVDSAPNEAIAEGRQWYQVAHCHAAEIAESSGYTVRQVAGVLAALSPQNPWETNLRAARDLCHGIVPTYANITGTMLGKANRILDGTRPSLVLNGPKERAFYANILGYLNAVTTDVWHSGIATVGPHRWRTLLPHVTRTGEVKPSRMVINFLTRKGNYQLIAEATRQVARDLGWTPAEVQAVAWCAERNDYTKGAENG